jgi:hypothetical protein
MEKPEDPEKTTDLSQDTDKLYHIMLMLYTSHWSKFELPTSVVIGIGSWIYGHDSPSILSNFNVIVLK